MAEDTTDIIIPSKRGIIRNNPSVQTIKIRAHTKVWQGVLSVAFNR
ncbi:hypothetical protein [Methylobacter sp.]